MFCNQCEQTAGGIGCTICGVCSKDAPTSNTMDSLLYALRGNALVALAAREENIIDYDYDMLSAQFTKQLLESRHKLLAKLPEKKANVASDVEDVAAFIESHKVDHPNTWNSDPDVQSLMQTIVFGLKGLAAYASHAAAFLTVDTEILTFVHKALAAGYDNKTRKLEEWIELALEVGKYNFQTMSLLDKANNTLGHPTPTEVKIGPVEGKCILISGHDLLDLSILLPLAEAKGINVYTHGEMLPAHGYPELKKYKNFVGHYGTAWQNQQKEFAAFPGSILMTTNCLMRPLEEYSDRIFTTGEVGYPGLKHITNKEFDVVIESALKNKGFDKTVVEDTITTGFSHHAIVETDIMKKLLKLIGEKKINHIYVVGGCDGAKPGRNYYTDLVEKIPQDAIVLTCGCGKYRFFRHKLGDIEGIPRLIDNGQCNDSFSSLMIAVAIAKELGCGVNDLPLSVILSWYEQKAAAVLLTILHLGIKNVRVGPTLPAFLSKNVLKYLVDTYGLGLVSTPEEDISK
ncbi:Hydroxylamine reductase [Entamoeba marina]